MSDLPRSGLEIRIAASGVTVQLDFGATDGLWLPAPAILDDQPEQDEDVDGVTTRLDSDLLVDPATRPTRSFSISGAVAPSRVNLEASLGCPLHLRC
jgi:hypothetical protein